MSLTAQHPSHQSNRALKAARIVTFLTEKAEHHSCRQISKAIKKGDGDLIGAALAAQDRDWWETLNKAMGEPNPISEGTVNQVIGIFYGKARRGIKVAA